MSKTERTATNPYPEVSLSDDLVWGIKGIAEELGLKPRQAFHLIENGRIPCGKIGDRVVGSRTKLRQAFEAITGEVA
jgi:hypothetical protein